MSDETATRRAVIELANEAGVSLEEMEQALIVEALVARGLLP